MLNNRPFLTAWDAASCQPPHPPLDETTKGRGRDGEGEGKRERIEGGGARAWRV